MVHRIIVPVFTAFKEDGSINPAAIEAQATYLAKTPATTVFVNGTTGESMSLTTDERKAIAEAWKRYLPPTIEIVVHIGTQSIIDSKALASHAQALGVAGIAAITPSFFKPTSVKDLVSYMKEVAAAAPQLPFYYYHFPGMTNVPIKVSTFLELASSQIPTLRGAKFTDTDMEDFSRCVRLDGGRFEMWIGYGLTLGLLGLTIGSGGSFVYGYLTHPFKSLVDQWNNNGIASSTTSSTVQDSHIQALRSIQCRLGEMSDAIQALDGLGGAKAIESRVVTNVGQVRLPLAPFPSSRQPDVDRFVAKYPNTAISK